MTSFNNIASSPIPNQNTVGFSGMSSKQDYFVWRKSSAGFFVALDKEGAITTWSTQNGKLLYKNKAGNDCSRKNLKGYAVYRSDPKDTTYTTWWASDFDKMLNFSFSLLVTRYPIQIKSSLQFVGGETK